METYETPLDPPLYITCYQVLLMLPLAHAQWHHSLHFFVSGYHTGCYFPGYLEVFVVFSRLELR